MTEPGGARLLGHKPNTGVSTSRAVAAVAQFASRDPVGVYWGLNQLIGLRSGPPISAWQPFVSELSSVLPPLQAIAPAIIRERL